MHGRTSKALGAVESSNYSNQTKAPLNEALGAVESSSYSNQTKAPLNEVLGKDQGGVGGAKHQAAQAASLPPRRAREDVGRDQGLGSGLLNESKQRRRARGGVRAALVSRSCVLV